MLLWRTLTSMYYDYASIESTFESLVGFQNSNNSNIPDLASSLTVSDSGHYYTEIGASEFLTIQNLYRAYLKDDYSSFNYFLTEFRRGVIRDTINLFVKEKIEKRQLSKELLEDAYIFRGNTERTETDKDVFFGWRIKLNDYDSLKLQVHRIALNLSSNDTTVNLYLYHNSQSTEIKVQSIATITAGSFSWQSLTDWVCKFADDNYKPNGIFYLGFYGADLGANVYPVSYEYNFLNPIRKDYNFSTHSKLIKYATITPFTISSEYFQGGDSRDLFDTGYDEENLNYTYDRSLGLTANVSTIIDITDYLKRHASRFINALKINAGLHAIKVIKSSTRATGEMANLIERAYIEDQREDNNGIHNALRKEIKAIDFVFSDLDSPAFPSEDTVLKLGGI